MYSRVRSRAGAVLLAAVAVTGNGLLTSAVHAQDDADPTTIATPAADRFRPPAVADLATDATRSVVDVPQDPGEAIDLTPVIDGAQEALETLPAEEWEVPALAATLTDMDGAFSLVRDGVAFDAYRGLLRGAEGTLAARAGGSFDRAALLKALLDSQRLTTRYAFGTLDRDTATAVVARSFERPTHPLTQPGHAFDDAFESSVDQRARRDHALLVRALGDRIRGNSADQTEQAIIDVTDHAWVQVEQTDGSWLDLDPTMPSAQPGDTLTAAVTTGDVIPESQQHMLTLRVIAEHLIGSSLETTTVMDETLPAAAAGDQRIFLTFTETGEGSGGLLNPGGLLGGGGGGPATWAPTLLIDHNAWDGDPILFTGEVGGGGLLGPGSQADLVSLALEIGVTSPGREPRVIHQVLADRLSGELRAAGSVTPDALAPVADDDGTPAIFRNVVHVMASTGATDPRAYAQDQVYAASLAAWGANSAAGNDDLTLNEALVPAAVADQALVVASEQRFVPAIDDADVRTFIATPRVYLATRSIGLDDLDERSVVTDLAIDEIRTLASAASADAAARQLWYGSLAGAFETEYALANAAAIDTAGRVLEGVSFDMAKPLSVIAASDTVRPEAAATDLDELLDAGGLAVVPGDILPARTWWEVSSDATTRSVLAPRLGGNGVRGPSSGGKGPVMPVNAPDKARDQRKQQDDGKAGNEYGTLVDNVAGKVEKGARKGGRIVQDGWDDVAKPLVKLS